jgi:hypothetical protein
MIKQAYKTLSPLASSRIAIESQHAIMAQVLKDQRASTPVD